MNSIKWMCAVFATFLVLSSSPLIAKDNVRLAPAGVESQQVDINRADAQALADTLKGIGMKRANAIVAYRDANGFFGSVEDLQKVKGVSAAIIQKNIDRIKF